MRHAAFAILILTLAGFAAAAPVTHFPNDVYFDGNAYFNVNGSTNTFAAHVAGISNSVAATLTNLTALLKDPSGWRDGSVESGAFQFDTNTRVLTITNAAGMTVYRAGAVLTNATTLSWPALGTNRGAWYLGWAYSNKAMFARQTAWAADDIRAAGVEWSGGTNGTALVFAATHGFMPSSVRRRFDADPALSAAYVSGLALTATNGGFALGAGAWADEDVLREIATTQTSGLVAYADGTRMTYSGPGGAWYLTNALTGALQYNQGGTNLADVAGGEYVSAWAYALRLANPSAEVVWVAGRTAGTLAAITQEAPPDLSTIGPPAAALLLYRVILAGSNATVASTTDYRASGILAAQATVRSHATLAGRDEANQHPIGAISGLQASLAGIESYYADGYSTVKSAGNVIGVHPDLINLVWQLELKSMAEGLSDAYGLSASGGEWFTTTNEIDRAASSNWVFSGGFRNWSAGEARPANHWKMNDDAASTVIIDSIGTNAGVAQQNSSTLTAAGKINAAITFDADSYVSVAPSAAGSFANQSWTIAAWVFTPASWGSDSDFAPIFCADHSTGGIYYSAHLRIGVGSGSKAGYINMAWNDGANYQSLEGVEALPTEQWVHIAVVYESGRQEIYTNGTLAVSGTRADTIAYVDQEVWIGKSLYVSPSLSVLLDDVRYYASALTSAEVSDLYNAGSGTESEGADPYVTNMVISSLNSIIAAGPASNVVSIWPIECTNAPATNWLRADVSGDGGTNWAQAAYTYSAGRSNLYWVVPGTSTTATLSPGVIKSRFRMVGDNPPRVTVKGNVTMGGSPQ